MTNANSAPAMVDDASIARAVAAGLIAGLVASFVMDRFQAAIAGLSPARRDAEPATDKTADRIVTAATGHALAPNIRPLGGQIVHYALGAGLGAAYGIAADYRRGVTAGRGTMFGIVVAALLDEAIVPAARLGAPPWRTSPRIHAYSLISHLVFGVIAEKTRVRVRAALAPRDAGHRGSAI